MKIDLWHGDCLEKMKDIPDSSVDFIITSPPYDNLRNYNNSLIWSFDIFQKIAFELFRVLKNNRVIVWVVSDATHNGSETGTSFKQALFFKEIGFKIHDTMIYKKKNFVPLTHKRYEQEFEYIFCLLKGSIEIFNPIKIKCKFAGQKTRGNPSFYKTKDDKLTKVDCYVVSEEKIKGNVFEYQVGGRSKEKSSHPAVFPLDLAKDQILSWTNQNFVVLDPLMGSGTVGLACVNLNRSFIGIEKNDKYFEIAKNRIESHKDEDTLNAKLQK